MQTIEEKRRRDREYHKIYDRTERGKIRRRAYEHIYNKTPKYKSRRKVWQKHYRETSTKYKKRERRYFLTHKESLSVYAVERRRKIKHRAIEYKGGRCVKCGYNKCAAAMVFHHLYPSQKNSTFNALFSRKWEELQKELDKCILLCSNCHCELHDELDRKKEEGR